MTDVLPLNPKIAKKANKMGARHKLKKAINLFSSDYHHPSLNTELLEPKVMGIWSFRVDRKIRALFIWRKDQNAVEIINITKHYH